MYMAEHVQPYNNKQRSREVISPTILAIFLIYFIQNLSKFDTSCVEVIEAIVCDNLKILKLLVELLRKVAKT
jgi:hypothetical protein